MAELKEAKAGPDWICLHCEASNRATLDQCGGCGAPRGSSPTQPVVRYGEGQVPRAATPAAPLLGAAAVIRRPAEPEPPPRRNVKGWVAGGLIAAVVIGGIIGEREPRARVHTPDPVLAVVEDLRWERTVLVAARTLVPGEGWELPDSATDVQQSSRVRDHRQEVAGHHTVRRVTPRRVREVVGERRTWVEEEPTTSCETVDLGNGYFDERCEETGGGGGEWVTEPVYRTVTVHDTTVEQRPYYRTVPVHATYYTYRVPTWPVVDTVRAAGGPGTPPAWPGAEVAPDQRASHHERYEVAIRLANGSREVVMTSEQEWQGFRPGQPIAYARPGGRRYWAGLLPRDSLPDCRRWLSGRGKPPPDTLGCSPRPVRTRSR